MMRKELVIRVLLVLMLIVWFVGGAFMMMFQHSDLVALYGESFSLVVQCMFAFGWLPVVGLVALETKYC
jgi:hypothetical protein